jgi:hypothetical protein
MIEKRHLSYIFFFTLFLGVQLAFWHQTTSRRPDMSIMPTPLSPKMLDVLSFGDKEFMFRLMGFQVSNAGDTFGRTTRLIDYDITPVVAWLDLLDTLNPVSDVSPFMAAYYFGQSQNISHIRPVVTYLERHSARDLVKKWWWRIQAAYLATHRLEDKPYALKLTLPLAKINTIPLWAQQYPAFVYEQQGEMTEALHIIESVVKSAKEIPEGELGFMRAFVENRIKRLDQINPEVAKKLIPKEKATLPSK